MRLFARYWGRMYQAACPPQPGLCPAVCHRRGRSVSAFVWAGMLAASLLAGCGSLPPMPARTVSTALATPHTTPLGQLVQAQRTASGTPYHSGFVLLGGAEAAFSSRLALVQAATRTLDLQYYAIHADGSTARLLHAVVQAAQRGVHVRVLLDDFHGAGKNAQVMRLAFVPGVEMRMFNPLTGPRGSTLLRSLSTLTDFQRAQQRMHNKLFIADNTLGITGGRNLGDAYFDALDSDNFVDLDVMAAGNAVRQLSASFDRYWADARAYPVESLISLDQLEALRRTTAFEMPTEPLTLPATPMDLQTVPWIWAPAVVLADAPSKIPPPPEDTPPTAWDAPENRLSETRAAAPSAHTNSDSNTPLAQASTRADTDTETDADTHAAVPAHSTPPPTLLPTSRGILPMASTPNRQALRAVMEPLAQQDNVVSGLLALIAQARQDLLIVSPYFVPGADMKQAFADALGRGVRVRILTNSLASNDAPLAHAGYARHRPQLLAMGVQLYELRSLKPGHSQEADPGTLRSTAGHIVGSRGNSRAMLHSKMVVLDHKLTVVGSMNLDLRSQLQNTEIALLIASRQLAQAATDNIESSLREAAWKVEPSDHGLVWRAPPDSEWEDQTTEPDASLPLRWMIRLIGPLAPDHLL